VCRQVDQAGIKVLDDFCEPLEERPMGFIEDEEVEETWAELCVAERQPICSDPPSGANQRVGIDHA
jgi:hypothetical protein